MENYQPVEKNPKSGMKIRYIFALLFTAFVGGAILSVWAADHFGLFGAGADRVAAAEAVTPPVVTSSSDSAAAVPALGPMTDRVEDLEARLSRINAATAAASGNAARAEGMLVADAARRAIDNGEALGYVENQLRTRFGPEQPAAVNQIAKAAQNPVTLDLLRAELESQGNNWLTPSGLSAWARFKQEISELFVLRRAESSIAAPRLRLQRARQYAETGNIKYALAEIENLPGKTQAQDWIEQAQSYIAVRNALDVIQRAALARPAPAPAAATETLRAAPASPAPAPAPAPANTSGKIPIDNQNDYTIWD